MKTKDKSKRKKHRILKFLLILLLSFVVVIGGLYFMVATHPQMIVDLFQSVLFSDEINSFEPRNTPIEGIKENGILYVSEIQYGAEYPNSYLDISYPGGEALPDKPTIVFFHGGGFFGGDKSMGDPLASNNDANYMIDSLCLEGYNLVNVNYALVPDYHFPVPLLQVNEALGYLSDHAEELHLDMDRVIIAGSSAGAILTSQYGAVLSNPEYSELIGITPSISVENVIALVIDDAPLEYDHFTLGTKILVGNYLAETIFVSKDLKEKYNPIPFITSSYPTSFLAGSNYHGDGYAYDMETMAAELEKHNVTYEFYYQLKEDGTESNHGFIADMKNDKNGELCFKAIVSFLNGLSIT